ncbi:MAG: hypothetical protein A2201_13815 [Alicyclobacillus sp. RIFOXYA1_FULL_53_8]|nr:MAG: hypothetical protein A2201_13815 [Alicyclobacillus sp. RIFOXYA1_FULL_53_8]
MGMTEEFKSAAASLFPAVGNFIPTNPLTTPESQPYLPGTKKSAPSGVATSPNTTTSPTSNAGKGTGAGVAGSATGTGVTDNGTKPGSSNGANPSTAGLGTAITGGNGATTHPASPTVPAVAIRSGQGVTAIGDSVLIDASPYLQKLLPGMVLDGQVGRQMLEAGTVVNQLKSEGKLGSRVIIELGTNGPFTSEQLGSLIRSIGPVQEIILVNVRVPRPWESVVNTTLAQVAAAYPQTKLVDWYAASANNNEYFYPDGVHLNPQGSQAYANLVAAAVESVKPPQG